MAMERSIGSGIRPMSESAVNIMGRVEGKETPLLALHTENAINNGSHSQACRVVMREHSEWVISQ